MNRQQWLVACLVGVAASLATLLAMDLTGWRRAYAQDTTQTGYLAVVAGPLVRNRTIPLIVVDTQAMTIMTYDYDITGTYNELKLTCTRSFKYDRKLIEYSHRNYSRPHQVYKEEKSNTVEEIRDAVVKQKPID